jgi:putative hemolysin
MMTVFVLGMALVLLLDGIFSAARSALDRLHASRHLQTSSGKPQKLEQINVFLTYYSRTDASLSLFQMATRLLAVGFFTGILWNQGTHPQSGWIFLYLFLLAVMLAVLEWGASLAVMLDPEGWILRVSGLIWFAEKLAAPFTAVLLFFTRDLEETRKKLDQVSEADLKTLVDESHKEGLLEREEQIMIHSVFRLDDTLTREIMVPRVDMLAIDAQATFAEAVKMFVESGHSRIPVYEGHIDNILGLLYAKDLLAACGNGDFQGEIKSLLREAYFVPESKVVNELLSEMQKKRVHLAIVVDEYGGVAGIVTLEDIIEEIFGEIQDEYDEEELPYFPVGPGEYIFQGKMDIDDLNLILGSSLPKQEADTIGGLVYYRLGHVPKPGEIVKFDDLLIKVEQVDEHRIIKVRIEKLSRPSGSEEKISHETN